MNIQTGDVNFFEGVLNRATLALQAQSLGGKNTIDGAHLQSVEPFVYKGPVPVLIVPPCWMKGTKPKSASQLHCYTVITESPDFLSVQITYWWFFNYNEGKALDFLGHGGQFGNHVADWEHVTILLNRSPSDGTFSIQQLIFDHHGDKTYINKDSVNAEFGGTSNKQVTVYLAKGSHECYPKAGQYPTAIGTHDFCDQGLGLDTSKFQIEIYTYDKVHSAFEEHTDAQFNSPDWLVYFGRWGNLAAGISIDLPFGFGKTRQLIEGPEGLKRPVEYSLQCSYEIGLTGQRCSGSPTVVWFKGQYICYFDNSDNINYITSSNGLQWTLAATYTHLGCSDEPVAVVFNGEVHLLFRDGGGNGLLHASSSTGYFEGKSIVDYLGIDIDWKPSAAIKDDGISKCLVVLARGHGSKHIMIAKLTVGTNGDKGTWTRGNTNFDCNNTPSIVRFKDQFLCYFQDPNAYGIFVITSDDDGTTWQNNHGSQMYTSFNTSAGPAAVVANGLVYVFYHAQDSNNIMNIMSNDGVRFITAPYAYIGLDCDSSPAVVHIDNGSTLVLAKEHDGSNLNYAVNPDGLKRPDGYPAKAPYKIGFTGQRCSGSPTVVWFKGQYICYFKADNSDNINYITSSNGLQWTLAATYTHLGCSDEPVAVVFNGEVHLLFRDGGGNGLLHASSSTGYFEGKSIVDYLGIDIDWKPSAAIKDDGISKCLVVLARGHGSKHIMIAKLTVGTNGDKGTWTRGNTNFDCNNTPSIVRFKDQFLCYFQDPNAYGIFVITSDDDGTTWQNNHGSQMYTSFNTSAGPAAVVANGLVYVFYHAQDSNNIMNIMSNDGVRFITAPYAYIGLDCDSSPAVVHIDNGSTLVLAKAHGGNNLNYAVNTAL